MHSNQVESHQPWNPMKIQNKRSQPGVNLINIICAIFSYERLFGSFYYLHVARKKGAKKTFVRKNRAYNVDEIDTYRQFHQRFFARFFHTIVLFGSFSSYVSAWCQKFVQKTRAKNVDEIDTCSPSLRREKKWSLI